MNQCTVAAILDAIGNGDAEQLDIAIADHRRSIYHLTRTLQDTGHHVEVSDLLRHRHRTCPCYGWD